jgi:hypothetical protein
MAIAFPTKIEPKKYAEPMHETDKVEVGIGIGGKGQGGGGEARICDKVEKTGSRAIQQAAPKMVSHINWLSIAQDASRAAAMVKRTAKTQYLAAKFKRDYQKQ